MDIRYINLVITSNRINLYSKERNKGEYELIYIQTKQSSNPSFVFSLYTLIC